MAPLTPLYADDTHAGRAVGSVWRDSYLPIGVWTKTLCGSHLSVPSAAVLGFPSRKNPDGCSPRCAQGSTIVEMAQGAGRIEGRESSEMGSRLLQQGSQQGSQQGRRSFPSLHPSLKAGPWENWKGKKYTIGDLSCPTSEFLFSCQEHMLSPSYPAALTEHPTMLETF